MGFSAGTSTGSKKTVKGGDGARGKNGKHWGGYCIRQYPDFRKMPTPG
jgi:hypothetical protein